MATEETLLIKLILDVQQSITAIDKLEKQFAGLSASIKSAFSTAANKDALNNLASEQLNAAKATEQLTNELKKQQRQADATKFPEGSYRQLNAQLKDLNNRFKELSATERKGIIGQNLAKEINRVKNELKGIDASIGDFQRNVGNYAGGLRGLFRELGANLKTIGLAGTLRSLPQVFGLLQGGIEKVLQVADRLGQIFSSNARVSRLLAEAQAELVSEYVKEKAQLDFNFDAALSDQSTKEQRAQAIQNINTLYGEYLPNLLTEASSNLEIADAQRIANAAIIENIVQKQKAAIVEKAINDFILKNIEAKKQEAVANQLTTGTLLDFFDANTAALRISSALATQEAQTAKAAASSGKQIEGTIRETLKELETLGVEFKDAFNPDGDKQTAGAFEQLSQQKTKLEQEIRNLIATNADYSKQQTQLRTVTRQLTDAEKEFAAATRFSETELERLNRRNSELETQIKNLALTGKDYSKQLAEQQAIKKRLAEVDKILADANKEAETRLESLSRRQKELNDEIQNAIANGQPYGTQLNELIGVTKDLTNINKGFQSVQAQINKELREFADGSLADYDAQLKELQETQKNLNLSSAEYADITAQIEGLENERNVILKALSTNLAELNSQQQALNDNLTDQQAQNAALESAKQRIAAVTDATGAGAAQIEQINKELADELKRIDDSRLQRQLNNIDAQIAALEVEKQKQLAIVGENETAKLAIEAQFAKDSTDLQLQAANIKGQILKKEVEEAGAAQESITAKTSEEAEKRKTIESQVLDAIGQAASGIFEIIANAQQAITEKQIETLEAEKKAALERAEAFGASEEAKAQIEKDFDAKREKIERDAATRAKALALAQATIDVALMVIKALASGPPVPNPIAGGIAAALGAIQIAIIASQKFAAGALFDLDTKVGSGNFFAKGAYLKNGAYHSEGGMPIINPFSGQKVAEIEKGEAIINRKNTALFYDELSYINSYKGRGVSFPNASKINNFTDFQQRIKQKSLSYGYGGNFGGFNNKVLKLEAGAIVAADIAREANARFATTNVQLAALTAINNQLKVINQTLQAGFEGIPSTAQELMQLERMQKDSKNAG